MPVIVLELCGNLFPKVFVSILILIIVGSRGTQPCRCSLSCIVMHIDDTVHTIVHYIVNNLLYTSHPCCIHLSRRPCREIPIEVVNLHTHMWIPCHRNADCIESGLLEHLYKSLCCDWLSPCSLVVGSLALRPLLYPHIIRCTRIGIKGIAEIPAHTHISNGRGC